VKSVLTLLSPLLQRTTGWEDTLEFVGQSSTYARYPPINTISVH